MAKRNLAIASQPLSGGEDLSHPTFMMENPRRCRNKAKIDSIIHGQLGRLDVFWPSVTVSSKMKKVLMVADWRRLTMPVAQWGSSEKNKRHDLLGLLVSRYVIGGKSRQRPEAVSRVLYANLTWSSSNLALWFGRWSRRSP